MSRSFSFTRWILWNLMAGILSTFIFFTVYNILKDGIGDTIAQFIGALVMGLIWGTCQFYALQKTIKNLPAFFWISTTAVGMAIGVLAIGTINPTAQSSILLDSITPAVYGAIMGLLMGVSQWLVLRPITGKASGWMIWSLAAGTAAGGVFLAYMKILMLQGDEMIGVGVAMISGGIPVSIVYALVTGFFFKPRGEGAVIIKTKESS